MQRAQLVSPLISGCWTDLAVCAQANLGSLPTPLADALRAIHAVPAVHDCEDLLPEVVDQLFDAGLFSLTVPNAFGGGGADNLNFTHAMFEVGRLGAQYAITAVPHLCNGVRSIALFGTPHIQQRVLPRVDANRELIAFALTEDHGSDVAALRTRLTATAEGGYRLDGAKHWITNVPHAGHLVVTALCPDLCPRPGAATFVLLARDAAGLQISRAWPKITADGSATVSLYFDNIHVAPHDLFGEPGRAIEHFNTVVDGGRLGTAAAAIGIAASACEAVRSDQMGIPRGITADALDRRILLLRATVACSARLSDLGSADHAVTTALCKSLCTTEALALAQSLRDAYAAAGRPLPGRVRRALAELPLFRILEGPSEVISLHAMSVLLTRFIDYPSAGSAADSSGIDLLLLRYRRLLHSAREVAGIAQIQSILLPLADAGAWLHALACAAAVTAQPDCGISVPAAWHKQWLTYPRMAAIAALQCAEQVLHHPPAAWCEPIFSAMRNEALPELL
ncbi:MAG: acyl-CoA dehydrogenase family protein [Burkholderiales bacterium]